MMKMERDLANVNSKDATPITANYRWACCSSFVISFLPVMNFSSLPGGIHQINSGEKMGSSDAYLQTPAAFPSGAPTCLPATGKEFAVCYSISGLTLASPQQRSSPDASPQLVFITN